MAHLLNLERLEQIQGKLKVSRAERDALEQAGKRVELARLQAEIPRIEAVSVEDQRRLSLVEIHEALAGIDEKRAEERTFALRNQTILQNTGPDIPNRQPRPRIPADTKKWHGRNIALQSP